ncbi:MAG: hypothetical protein N2376_09720 [Clostridia bacterium]|nr:hypothetical protein [Clostridia bacterium]
MTKAEIVASKIHMAISKAPDHQIPYIIGALLRKYERYGLADLVETAWNWKPKGDETYDDDEQP